MSEEAGSANYRVLIVDDEPINIELLLEIFESIDRCDVVATTSPLEAVELYRQGGFALVLLDITMPEMNGCEVLNKFDEIELDRKPEVYVLTGHHDSRIEKEAINRGAKGLIKKPFEISEIVSLVEDLMCKT